MVGKEPSVAVCCHCCLQNCSYLSSSGSCCSQIPDVRVCWGLKMILIFSEVWRGCQDWFAVCEQRLWFCGLSERERQTQGYCFISSEALWIWKTNLSRSVSSWKSCFSCRDNEKAGGENGMGWIILMELLLSLNRAGPCSGINLRRKYLCFHGSQRVLCLLQAERWLWTPEKFQVFPVSELQDRGKNKIGMLGVVWSCWL